MRNIQVVREDRADVSGELRKLLDDNPGTQWTSACQKKYDKGMAAIDTIDAELEEHYAFNLKMARSSGQPENWTGHDGAPIPMAYAKNGAISNQLTHNDGAPAVAIGDFLRGVAGLRSSENVRNALSVGTDSAGGFTLPSFVQLQLLDALAPVSSMLTAGAGIAMLDDGAKSHRIAAMSTIPTAAWRAEGAALATSDPAFRSVDILPKSLSFQFKVSRELLMDSANLEQALFAVIALSFARELDRAGLRGTGTLPEPRGILNTTGIQAVTNGANGASLATTAYANFISSLQSILQSDGPMPTAAIMSPRSLTTLGGLLDTTNQPRGVPDILKDVKLIATSQVPNNVTVGTSTDCTEVYVGDFSKAAFFMREGVSIQLLTELFAGTGELGFACHTRVDVGILYPAAFAVVTGVRA